MELPTGDRSADTSPKAYPAHYAPPPPPASLEPMAMGALGADDSQQRPALRFSKTPPLSVGIALLVLGAIFGATFSLVQRTHQHRVATASAVVVPPRPSMPEAAPIPVAAPVATVATVESTHDAAIELDASAPVAASRATARKVAPKSIKRTKAGRPAPTKSAPKAKEEAKLAAPKPVVAKEAPKKPDAPASPLASAKTDDAAGLLKAAKGATENSL